MWSIITGLLSRVNGWKSVIGYGVAWIGKLVESQFPDAPVQELGVVLQYAGEALLAVGLAHVAAKNVAPAPKPQKKGR